MLIIRRSKLYYTAPGIITPVGSRPVHTLLTRLFAQQDIESFRCETFETYTGVKIKVKVKFIIEETTKT